MPPRTLPADFDFEAEQAPRTLPADFDFEAEEKQYDWDIPEPSKRYNKLSTPELKRDEAEMMFEKDVINTEWWRNASDEERRARRNDYWEKNNISEDMEMGQRLEQTIEESWDTPEEAELLGEHLTSREDLIPKEPAGSEYGGARELFNVDVPEQKPEQKPEQPRLFKKELPSEIPSIVDSIPKMVMGKFPQRVDHRAVDKEHLQDPERARVSDIVESEMNDAIVYLSKNVNLEGKVEDRVGEATGIMTKMLDENEGYDKLTDAGKARLFGRVMALLVKPTDEEIRALDKEKGQGVKGLKKAWKQVAYTIGGDNADQIEGMMAEEFMRTMDMTKSKDFRDMVVTYDRDAFGDSVLFPKWKNASWAKEVNDYITGADKGELLRVEQGTVGRGGMAYVAEYSPEIALAVGTMFLPTLSSAIVADLASWELIRLAKQGGEDYTAEKMYNDVELPAIIGASIVATAKMFKMGKNIKGAEGHFGKKFEDLSPDELREYKMYQENADEIIKSAEQSRKAEEDLAKDEEIAKNLNDEREINKAYDEIKDITSEAEVQSIFKQRKEAEIKDRLTELKKEFDDTTHKVATGQYTKEQGEQFLMDAGERILKKPMEEFDAKAKKVYDKWANTHGFQANAMGNAGFGGAMGGATLGAMSGIYEQMVNGEDVSTEEFLARIIGGGFGGYGVSKNTTTRGLGMYVGATPKPLHTTPPVTSKQSSKLAKQDAVDVVPTYAKGSQSNLADKGTREWIDDSGAKLKKVTYYSPADELAIGNKPKKLAEWEAKRTEALNTEGLTEQQIKNVNQNVDRAIESIKSKNPVAYIDTARSLQDKMPHRFKLEKLDDFYDHPELFKRYPELKDVRLQFRSGMRPTDKGFYNQSENLMVINKSLSDKEALSVIAHETQHGIQSLEDWARGGNTEEFKDIIHPDNKKVIADNVKYRTQVDKLERDRVYRDQKIKSEKLYDEKYKKQLDESTDYVETKKIMKAYKDESESLYPKLHSTERRTAKLRNQMRRSNPNINDSAYEQYTRLAGEQESRAVQAKLKHPNLDPYEALAKEEGKIPEPIVKFDGNVVTRSEDAPAFYSVLERTLDNSKTRKMTVSQLKGYMKKNGVKDEELRVTGIGKLLDDMNPNDKVNLDDIRKQVLQPEFETVTKGGKRDLYSEENVDNGSAVQYHKWSTKGVGEENYREVISTIEPKAINNGTHKMDDGTEIPLLDTHADDTYTSSHFQGDPGYLKHKRVVDLDTYDNIDIAESPKTAKEFGERYEIRSTERYQDNGEPHARMKHEVIDKETGDVVLTKNSAREGDRLVEQMMDELGDTAQDLSKKGKGEKTLHMDESQSDLHQEGRKKGYAGEGAEEKAKLLAENKATREGIKKLRAKEVEIGSDLVKKLGVPPYKIEDFMRWKDQEDVLISRFERDKENLAYLEQKPKISKQLHDLEMKYPDIDFDDYFIPIADNIRKRSEDDAMLFEHLVQQNTRISNIEHSPMKLRERIKETRENHEAIKKYAKELDELQTARDATQAEYQKIVKNEDRMIELDDGVPKAPLMKTEDWTMKNMKELIDEAVKNDYKWVTWTDGKTQAERYNLANTVDYLKHKKNTDGSYDVSIFTKEQGHFKTMENVQPKEIADTLGKAVADDIVTKSEVPPEEGVWHNMHNQDIPIGGEGMKSYYDKMLPKWMKKYLKQYDSKVEVRRLQDGKQQLGFKVTDKMKSKIKSEGQPLYTNDMAIGAMYGFEQNEDGTYSYDLKNGIMGAVGARIAKKALTSKQMKDIIAKHGKPLKEALAEKGFKKLDDYVKSLEDDVTKYAGGGKPKEKSGTVNLPYEATISDKFGGARRRFYDALKANPKINEALTKEIAEALTTPAGISRVLKLVGINVKDTKMLVGSFEGKSNPLRHIEVPIKYNADGTFTKESKDKLDLVSAVFAKLLHQDGVGYFDAKLIQEIDDASAFYFPMGAKFTKQMAEEIFEKFGVDAVAHPSGKGFQIVDFMGDMDNLHDIAEKLGGSLLKKSRVGRAEAFIHHGGYEGKDWADDTIKRILDETYTSDTRNNRLNKFWRDYNDLSKKTDGIYEKYSAKFGLDWNEKVPVKRGTKVGNSASNLYLGKEKLDWANPNITQNRQLAEALDIRSSQSLEGVIGRSDYSKEASEKIAEALADEIETAIKANPENSGIGWYSDNFNEAVDILSKTYPKIKEAKNKNIFTAIVAVTSDGAEVKANLKTAIKLYDNYTKTGTIGATKSGGKSIKNINNNLQLLDALIKEHGDGLEVWLKHKRPISEIAEDLVKWEGKNLKGKELKDAVDDWISKLGYPRDFEGVNSFVFGAKLGAFFQNLSGGHGFLTMDRWWMRSINRLRGGLSGTPTEKSIREYKDLLVDMKILSRRKADNLTIDELKAEVKKWKKIYEDSEFKDKTPINVKSNTLGKNFVATNDSPKGGADRVFMIDTAEKALAKLKAKGYDLTMADAQAVEWYFEKTLFKNMGVPPKNDNIGYGEAVKQIMAEEKATMRGGFATGSVLRHLVSTGVGAVVGAGMSEEDNKLQGAVLGAIGGAIAPTIFTTKYIDDALRAVIHTPLGKVASKADNATGQKLSGVIKRIKDSDVLDIFTGHKIYTKKDYMKMREDMIARFSENQMDTELLHSQLKNISEPNRNALYNYMTGDTTAVLPPHLKTFADDYIKIIDNMGQELVDLGVLDQKAFDKFKGQYLKRSYSKHLSERTSVFSNKKTIDKVHQRGNEWKGDQDMFDDLASQNLIGDFTTGHVEAIPQPNGTYVFRQDWTLEQRERWGEITDIAYALPITLNNMANIKANATLLKRVSQHNGYVLDDVTDEIASQYTLLKGKKYGALDGKYVVNDVASDIGAFADQYFGRSDEAMAKLKTGVRGYLSMWKASHTIYNPKAHMNNLLSNVTLQAFEDVSPEVAISNAIRGGMAMQKYRKAVDLLGKKMVGLTQKESDDLANIMADDDVKLYVQAYRAGLFGRSKLNDILNVYVQGASEVVKDSWLAKIKHGAEGMYGAEDNIMRFSMLKSFVDRGVPFDEAISKTNKVIPDYSKPMSIMARKARESGIIPFVSWTYYSLPILVRQMNQNPAKMLAMAGGLTALYASFGLDPFSGKDTPTGYSFKSVPIYKEGDEVTTLKIDKWMPHAELLNPYEFTRGYLNAGAWQPAIDLYKNHHSFFDRPITQNKGGKKVYDLVKFGMQNVVPSPDILDQIYNLAESQIRGQKRRKTKVYTPRDVKKELLGIGGFNVKSYNLKEQRKSFRNKHLSTMSKKDFDADLADGLKDGSILKEDVPMLSRKFLKKKTTMEWEVKHNIYGEPTPEQELDKEVMMYKNVYSNSKLYKTTSSKTRSKNKIIKMKRELEKTK